MTVTLGNFSKRPKTQKFGKKNNKTISTLIIIISCGTAMICGCNSRNSHLSEMSLDNNFSVVS